MAKGSWRITALALFALLAACDRGAVPAQRVFMLSARPQLGGSVVRLGRYQLEVRASASGSVDAVLFDQHGRAVADPTDLRLTLQLSTRDGGQRSLAMHWEHRLARFQSQAGANASLVSGPAGVQLEGRRVRDGQGHVSRLTVLPLPSHGGVVMAVGELVAELVLIQSGRVHAYLTDVDGSPVQNAGGPWSLRASVTGRDGQAHPVALRWSEKEGCFAGSVREGSSLVSGPLALFVERLAQPLRLGRMAEAAVLEPPRIAGAVVAVGDRGVEVRPSGRREIEAVVHGPSGALRAEDGEVLKVFLQGTGGGFIPFRLRWDPERQRYRAKLQGNSTWGGPFRVSLHGRDGVRHGGSAGAPEITARRSQAYFAAFARGRNLWSQPRLGAPESEESGSVATGETAALDTEGQPLEGSGQAMPAPTAAEKAAGTAVPTQDPAESRSANI